MSNLSVKICGKTFKNPVIAASGTFNFGREFSKLLDINMLGGISTKGLTLLPREGNDSPRVAETPSGMLNSVGLQNPGFDAFARDEYPWLKSLDTVVMINAAGSTEEDYRILCEKLSGLDVDMVELNISCPNVKSGGMAFGTDCLSVAAVTKHAKLALKGIPLVVKLSPNVTDIKSIAKAAEDAGADAISLINTLSGMAVDINSRRPILANVVGGLSGPCIKPVALKMVHDVYRSVKIPVIGMGGISCSRDVIEFMLCGASAVQVGTAALCRPSVYDEILQGLYKYCNDNGIKNISEITGGLIL